MTEHTVIVGAGLAAVRTAEQLRRQGYPGEVTIVGAESHPPYDRPPLSKALLRGERDDVSLKPERFYLDEAITLRLGRAATGVDTAARTVSLAGGDQIGYRHLVIATGLTPRRLPGPAAPAGVGVLRSLDDALTLRERARAADRAVVVGAGFIGCEVTAGLRALGVEVVLVEPQPTPLAGLLGEQVGKLVTRLHQFHGVDVRAGTTVTEIHGDDRVQAVSLDDGSTVPADLVVVGVGSHPVVDWLAGSGVAVDDGVSCDARGRTSIPDVWALGDVACWQDRLGRPVRREHWSNVAEQARTLVSALLDTGAEAPAAVPYFWSDQYDVKIQCLGEPRHADAVHLVEDNGRHFLAYYERAGVLVAAAAAGFAERLRAARGPITAGAAIGELLR